MPKIDWPAIDKTAQRRAKAWAAVPQLATELIECLKYQDYLRREANEDRPVPPKDRRQFTPEVQMVADRWLATLGLRHAQDAAQLISDILEEQRHVRDKTNKS